MANNFANSINSNIGASNSGATNTLTVTNPSNTSSSQALINVTVGGTSSGDAFTTYTVAGTTNWSEGVDNSDSDSYVLAASTALGTTNVIHAVVAGSVNFPLQPAFLARLGSADTNATGNGTVYTIGGTTALTEIFDQQNNFNTNGTFTAPVTGVYLLGGCAQLLALTALMTFGVIQLSTSNRTYVLQIYNYGLARTVATVADTVTVSGSSLCDMDAADTFTCTLQVNGGAGNTATVNGGTNPLTRVFGNLVC